MSDRGLVVDVEVHVHVEVKAPEAATGGYAVVPSVRLRQLYLTPYPQRNST